MILRTFGGGVLLSGFGPSFYVPCFLWGVQVVRRARGSSDVVERRHGIQRRRTSIFQWAPLQLALLAKQESAKPAETRPPGFSLACF